MKKIFFALAIFASTCVFANNTLDESITKRFKAAFPKAEKVSWYESDSYYQVLFTNNQVKCRLWYNREGNVIKTERYYTQEGLRPFLLAKLARKFEGKTVFGVTEVTTEDGILYHIVLQDAKKWYHVTATEGGAMHLDKKYIKA